MMNVKELLCLVSFCAFLGSTFALSSIATDAQWDKIIDKCATLPDPVAYQNRPVGLNGDCRAYSHCPNPFYLRPTVLYCPPGSLFDPESPTVYCNFAHRINCSSTGRLDPCNGEPNGLRPDTTRSGVNRGAILQCFRGRTVGGFHCPACYHYGDSQAGCVPIPNCIAGDIGPDQGCHLEANPLNERTFYSKGSGSKSLMDCGEGTVFRQVACNCVFPDSN